MSDTVIEAKPANPKADEWAERIAAQQRSGMSVKQFCKEQGLTEYSFYAWRKRLQENGPVRFALVERSARRQERPAEAVLELVLATGERLRIGTGVDAATLRTVLDVVAGMIHLPASVRVYLCLTPCDMRKSFDSLHALVREHLELDAFAGHLFVFASRRKDRVKILYWDRDGSRSGATNRLHTTPLSVPGRHFGGLSANLPLDPLSGPIGCNASPACSAPEARRAAIRGRYRNAL